MPRKTASYEGLKPASVRASSAARGASKKGDTKPEVILRKALWREGVRYRKNVRALPGDPDIVIRRARLVVFCDGDFWHGKDWKARRRKLQQGTNPEYWTKKIAGNIARDRHNNELLESEGWTVLRFWESEIVKNTEQVVARIQGEIELATERRPRPDLK